MAAPALEVSGVTKTWPRAPAPVLSEVELTVPPGALVLVDGANGAGKTTLLRVIAGLVAPDGGEVRIGGLARGERRAEYQRRLGVAAAGSGSLFARLDARAHLRFAARLQLVPRPRRPAQLEEAMARFGLGEFADRRVDRLSMGQRQRLRLALTFLHQPDLVLLDEPATSLDDRGRRILDRAIVAHRARGGAVVWCSPGTVGSVPEHAPAMRLHRGRLLPA